jgi:hypothetical protein
LVKKLKIPRSIINTTSKKNIMSSIISKASQAIQMWNQERSNPAAVTNFFNQGTFFKIDRSDYLIWKNKNPEFIHAYLGLVLKPEETNFSLSLFSVDSVTDKDPVEGNQGEFEANIKENAYELSVISEPTLNLVDNSTNNPENITPIEGMMRTVQWSLHKDIWIDQQEDMVQVFEIPFFDLGVLFDSEEADYIILSPALKEQEEDNTFKIDLVLWGYNSNGVTWNKPMDFIKPAPPFSNPANFQLLNYAL